jgi:cystathionine beta-lyase/cystathionine gamma-synthase
MVLQSATKYLGGHSDVIAGVLSGTYDMMKKIFDNELLNMGNGISPFNAWLLIRGLRTLPLRLQRISSTTTKVVSYLKQHPKIEQVIFPFDDSFKQIELARQQMEGACGLVTLVLRVDTMQQIVTFCESLKHMLMAVSWGGHESLVIPRCASLQPGAFDVTNLEHRMIRLYVGLEEPEYLIADLDQALAAV